MDEEEVRFLGFIYEIPLDTNPYDAAIEYLNSASTPPSLPQWMRPLLKLFVACYALMWLQSFYLLYVRFKTRMFRLITVTRLGLWRVDVPNMSGLAYFIYPPLVIADLTLQEKIDDGKRDLTNKVPLLACKFLVVLIATWAFLWVCACQCLSNYWDDQYPEALRHGRRLQLPRYVVVTMNILFVCLLTWFVPCVIYLTTRSNEEYKMIREILKQVVTSLRTYSSKYDAKTYKISTLITALLPASGVLIHEKNMAHYLRTALLIGLGDLIFLCLLYAPLLRYSVGAIQRRTEECTFAVTISPYDHESEHLAHIKHRVRQEYWTSFIHGVAVYLTALALVPILIYQASFSGSTFLRSQKWLTVTLIGMHGPFAISGNVIVFLLNLQAQRLLDIYRIQQNASRTCRSGANPLHLEVNSTSSGGVIEMPEPSPSSLGDKTMELETTK